MYKKPGAESGSEDRAATGDEYDSASPADTPQNSADEVAKGKGKGKDKKGKKPREKLVKRVERMWGEEVQQGQKIQCVHLLTLREWRRSHSRAVAARSRTRRSGRPSRATWHACVLPLART